MPATKKTKTQNDLILEHLQRYGQIDPLTALQRYGCFRLAARIRELRTQHTILTEMVETIDSRHAVYRWAS